MTVGDSVVSNDRDESRSARRHDAARYVRIGGLMYDDTHVPTMADLRGDDDWGDE